MYVSNHESHHESNMKGKVNIKSDYGSQKILEQSYLFKKSSIHFTVGELPCTINVYNDSGGNQRSLIDETIQLVQFVESLSTIHISKLILNLYLIDEKKTISEITGIITENILFLRNIEIV